MAASEMEKCLEANEKSVFTESTESLDLSCIHWGYLNCVLVVDPSRKVKDLLWKTYWVDLCGSTLRFYRDLSLPPESADRLPPLSVLGPSSENEKKEAFLMLKRGANVEITGYEEYKSKKKSKKAEPIRARSNTFKLMVSKVPTSPVYYFQAPSKGSMYRWISKIEEGIDNANKPQSHTTVDRKLQEAKMLAIEQRRYHLAPELKYSEKGDDDPGTEGDIDESFEVIDKPKVPTINPKLEKLILDLQTKQVELQMLERQEKAFLGDLDHCGLSKVCEFEATTKADYLIVPGHPCTLIPKATRIRILGQLANHRWRCYVDLPGPPREGTSEDGYVKEEHDRREVKSESIQRQGTKARVLGSVPTSLLEELDEAPAKKTKLSLPTQGGPEGTPGITPDASPSPSPPLSPYSPHRAKGSDDDNESETRKRREASYETKKDLPRLVCSPNEDAWDHFYLPSPPSSPVTSRSTSPSLTPSESSETIDMEGNPRDSISSFEGVPVTYIGGESGDEPPEVEEEQGAGVEVDAEAAERMKTDDLLPEVAKRLEDDAASESGPSEGGAADEEEAEGELDVSLDSDKNYSFQVTKKLRQRGISLIVGSSSSDEEDEDGDESLSKITRRKIDEEFQRFSSKDQHIGAGVRPYSAFVPRKRASINFGISSKTTNLRLATTDDLLRDYASPYEPPQIARSKTCSTLSTLREFSTPENTPPINQRRTLQMTRDSKGGFGFTLQTYGIVQQNGEVEYMTFVLAVEEDGPAYMAGMRPGDIIICIGNHNMEEEDHRNLVSMIQNAPASLRVVVVFVDAIKRMHLNTRMRILLTELQSREDEFEALSRREEQVYRGLGVDMADLNIESHSRKRPRQNSYLYTTELTSSFSKDSTDVRDSLIQYRQQANDRPRRTSLPDQSELSKHSLVCTTGTELLENFSSPLDASRASKAASLKLQKKVKKVTKSSSTFRTYVEIDESKPVDGLDNVSISSSSSEASLRLSWPPSGNGAQHGSNFEKSTSSPQLSGAQKTKKKENSPNKLESPGTLRGTLKAISPRLYKKIPKFPSFNGDSKESQSETSNKESKKGGSPKKSNSLDVPDVESKGVTSSPKVAPTANLKSSKIPRNSHQNEQAGVTPKSEKTSEPNTVSGSVSDQKKQTGFNQKLAESSSSTALLEALMDQGADADVIPKTSEPTTSAETSAANTTADNVDKVHVSVIQPGLVKKLVKEPRELLAVKDFTISKRSESLRELSGRGEVAKVVWPPRNSADEGSDIRAQAYSDDNTKCEDGGRENVVYEESECAVEEGKDRSGSLNISQLRRIFETSGESASEIERTNDGRDDVIVTVSEGAPSGIQPGTRARLGSRPESFMMAMDSAEDWQLIPQDKSLKRHKKKTKHLMYESSA